VRCVSCRLAERSSRRPAFYETGMHQLPRYYQAFFIKQWCTVTLSAFPWKELFNWHKIYFQASVAYCVFHSCMIFGVVGQSVGLQFYQTPKLTATLSGCLFAGLPAQPDHRLRVICRILLLFCLLAVMFKMIVYQWVNRNYIQVHFAKFITNLFI